MMWPDEEWYNQKVAGKEITIAEPDTAFYKQQLRAMKMEPGLTPRNEYWEDVLGHEKPSKNVAEQLPKKAAAGSFKHTPQSNGTPAAQASSAAAVPDPGRPKRAGRKRSYLDSSFVGYGEGFPDDDDLEGSLYSNEDDGSSAGKKKRKKMVRSSRMLINPPRDTILLLLCFDITLLTIIIAGTCSRRPCAVRTRWQLRCWDVWHWCPMTIYIKHGHQTGQLVVPPSKFLLATYVSMHTHRL